MLTTPEPVLYELTFSEASRSHTVVVEGDVVRNMRLLGSISTNGADYKAVVNNPSIGTFYEGTPVVYGHKPDVAGKPKAWGDKTRGLEDAVGLHENVRQEGDFLLTDVRVYPTHPHAGLFKEQAVNPPKGAGLSHVVDAYFHKTANGMDKVTEIKKVYNTAWVYGPGTLTTLREQAMETPLDFKTFTEGNPELWKEVAEAHPAFGALKAKVEAFEAKERLFREQAAYEQTAIADATALGLNYGTFTEKEKEAVKALVPQGLHKTFLESKRIPHRNTTMPLSSTPTGTPPSDSPPRQVRNIKDLFSSK